ncbi:MbtH family protein [Streptomyces fungicidicus]|uniref:MbtH family protein n=1 Tax=Streptomyces fungicidicus TaxID=68203 RepID=UPI003809024F
MSNPFDDPDGSFQVLINDEAQYSLWPAFAEIPGGWKVVHPESDRQTCVDFIEREWTDMRPTSLVEALEGSAA